MLKIIGKCLTLTKRVTCNSCGSIIEYTSDEVKGSKDEEHIVCPCCFERVVVWELKYEEGRVKAHSLKHVGYVNSLKKDDPVTIWRGSLEHSEKLHFRFIDHIAEIPTIFCYAEGKTSHTDTTGCTWMGWCLYHENYIINLKLIEAQILKSHPVLTSLQRSLK